MISDVTRSIAKYVIPVILLHIILRLFTSLLHITPDNIHDTILITTMATFTKELPGSNLKVIKDANNIRSEVIIRLAKRDLIIAVILLRFILYL